MAATTNEWEYDIVSIAGNLKDGLNLLGKDRWQVVTPIGNKDAKGMVFIVMRPAMLIQTATELPPTRPSLIGS